MYQINLEASINDVINMAAISALLMEKLTDTLHQAARAGVSGRQAIETHEWLVDLVSFASLETKLKAEELSKQFYAKDGRGGATNALDPALTLLAGFEISKMIRRRA